MKNYQYFLSFAGADNKTKSTINALEKFASILEEQVDDRTTHRTQGDLICFKHDHGSRAGNDWPNEVLHALQNSQVLVALLSRKYFESDECRREFQFFMDRSKLSKHADGGEGVYRIIPVFFEDEVFLKESHPSSYQCLKQITQLIDYRLEVKSLRDKHPKYPECGIARLCRHRPKGFDYMIHAVADKIDYFVNLNRTYALEQIPNPPSYREFPIYGNSQASSPPTPGWNVGPNGINVVYIVGTKAQIKTSAHAESRYGDTHETWRPFVDEAHVTIGSATREEYVLAVFQVITGLRRQIQQFGSPVEKRSAQLLPGLNGPTGNEP